jgi:hypothetical protein
VRRVSFVGRAATRDPKNPTQPRRKLLWKSEDAPNDPALPAKGGADMTPEEMQAALTKAEETNATIEKERDDALAKAEAAEKEKAELEKQAGGGKAKPAKGMAPDDENDPDEDELSKADLPEGVKVYLAKRDAEVAELRKEADANRERAESAEEIAKGERETRIEAEFVEMAKSELPHMGAPEVVGARLKKFSETLEKAEFDEYVREQTAINEQLRKGSVEAEYGRSGGRPAAPAAPGLPEAMKKAEELEKADPSMSSAEAMRRAMRDPAIAAQYEKERAGV